MGEYVTDKYALWLDFRITDENILHGTGRVIGSVGGGITLQIKKKAKTTGKLKAYIYLIVDAQLKIQNGAFIYAVHKTNGKVTHDGTPFDVDCGSDWGWKDIPILGLARTKEYLDHFDFVIILCPPPPKKTIRCTTDGNGFGLILMSF